MATVHISTGVPPYASRRRNAISSEATGQLSSTIANAVNLPSFPKTPEQAARLNQALGNHLMFRHLEDDERERVFGAMFEKIFKEGDVIIRQGDEGDNFYVVESGRCDIYVQRSASEPPQIVSSVTTGGSFGELALLYGTPRAATVVAKTPQVHCWALDRSSYRAILMSVTLKKRQMYEEFLEKVPVLAGITKWERAQIADALETQTYSKGSVIVKQGEPGDGFFIIVQGTVKVTKSEGTTIVDCGTLKESNYFGELALIFNQPRAATVEALTDVKCVKLDRDRFDRLLGPCEQILKRNLEHYNQVMSTVTSSPKAS